MSHEPDAKVAVPEIGFDHAAISVPDIEEAITWYRRILSFEVERRFSLPHDAALGAMLARGGMRIEIFQPANPVPLPPDRRQPDTDVRYHGNKHVAFRVDDIEPLAKWLESKGADIALRVDKAFGQALFVRDNSGNLIEFVGRPL